MCMAHCHSQLQILAVQPEILEPNLDLWASQHDSTMFRIGRCDFLHLNTSAGHQQPAVHTHLLRQ